MSDHFDQDESDRIVSECHTMSLLKTAPKKGDVCHTCDGCMGLD